MSQDINNGVVREETLPPTMPTKKKTSIMTHSSVAFQLALLTCNQNYLEEPLKRGTSQLTACEKKTEM